MTLPTIARRPAADPAIAPDHILELGFAFWGSQALLTAVELGVFSALADGPLAADALRHRLGLHERGARDFFDALVALRLLERTERGYANAPATARFLDTRQPFHIAGILAMCNARLYHSWGKLTEALRTGQPQNEAKGSEDLFDALYRDPARLRHFARAMTALNMGAAQAIAQQFPWCNYGTVLDVGTAEGNVPVQVVRAHPHVRGLGFDLPPLAPIFADYAAAAGLSESLTFHAGDFFTDPLPPADVVVMGMILHDWDLARKLTLVRKAYDALPTGGAFIVYDAIIDDARRDNAFGLLMSLNMLVETQGGFDYTAADCIGWLRGAGFHETAVEHLTGPISMVVGVK